jgi:hypothetical protein
MTVKLIRMSSGEDLIATLNKETDTNIVIQDAIVAVPTGSGSIGFVPWSPILSKDQKELTVEKTFVVYIAEPDEGVVKQYGIMFNKIITPSKKLIQ